MDKEYTLDMKIYRLTELLRTTVILESEGRIIHTSPFTEGERELIKEELLKLLEIK